MYAGHYAQLNPDRPAFIMASSGESVSYAEYDARTNRLAHLLRGEGLKRLDHYSVFMENNSRFLEASGAGERSGLYCTCINSFLTADELAYILNNSESQVLITSIGKVEVALKAVAQAPRIKRCLVVDGAGAELPARIGDCLVSDYAAALAEFPPTPIADEWLGTPMLYSSGTTGRPKGIVRPLPESPPSQALRHQKGLLPIGLPGGSLFVWNPPPAKTRRPNSRTVHPRCAAICRKRRTTTRFWAPFWNTLSSANSGSIPHRKLRFSNCLKRKTSSSTPPPVPGNHS